MCVFMCRSELEKFENIYTSVCRKLILQLRLDKAKDTKKLFEYAHQEILLVNKEVEFTEGVEKTKMKKIYF